MTATRPPESSNPSLETLSDQALLHEFSELVRQDHRRVASLLRHIDVIDRRKLWARQGHSSLFDFLVSRYHMSESTAGKRIGAARTARRFPILFRMVARGEIHLSGIHRLKTHLTPENHESVLAQARHKSIRQIEELVARLAPQPDVPSTLRALPRRSEPVAIPLPAPSLTQQAVNAAVPTVSISTSASAESPRPVGGVTPSNSPRSADPTPLSPGRYRLQVTLGQTAKDKLKQLQDLLAHQIPNGDPAAIVERALDALLTQVHKRRTGITAQPRAPRASLKPSRAPSPDPSRQASPGPNRQASPGPNRQASPGPSRAPSSEPNRMGSPEARSKPSPQPNARTRTAGRRRWLKVAVRREVWPRDDGRCGFIGEDGRRCNETRGLEFAHVHPWAKGGEDTPTNLGLRCMTHNALEADRDYGASFMASKRQRKVLKVREPIARYTVRRVPVAVELLAIECAGPAGIQQAGTCQFASRAGCSCADAPTRRRAVH